MEEGETDEILECTPKNVLRIFAEAGLSCNLRVLGSQLGLKTTHLDEIERLPNDQHTMTIVVRRSRSLQPLTWPLLVSVLRKPALKEYSAADYIERRCCPTDDAMMSPVSDSPSSDTSRFLLQRSLSSSTSSQEASLISSHGTDLTIPNVVNEIADISNWGELGIFLDLDGYDIKRIRDNYDPSEHHQRLIENWFARDPQRSWEKLHRAMEDASARRGSASSAASSMASFHSRSPVTPTSPIEIQVKVEKFEESFEELQIAARKEIDRKQNSVEMIQDRLPALPDVIIKQHEKHMKKIVRQNLLFLNLKEFFMYLNLYCWNFFEYHLLKHVIHRFCSQYLRNEMASYDRDMQWFQHHTTVLDFIQHVRHRITIERKTVPPRFKRLVLKKDIDPKSYTLADVERFRVDTCMHLKLSQCALQVFSFKHNCIIVEWIFPEELTDQLSCFFCSEVGQEILSSHHVENVTIDGQSLQSWMLLACVKNGDRERTLTILKEKHSDIYLNCRDWDTNYSSLLFVAERGDVEIVRNLIDEGADLNIENKDCRTALMLAVKHGHREVVEIFLEPSLKCQVNLQDKVLGWSALHFAADSGHEEIVELLTDPIVEANTLIKDNKGRTALQVAQERGYIEIVELLQPQAEEDHGDLDSPQAHGSGLFVEEPEPVGKEEEQRSDTPTTLTKEEGKDGGVLKGIRKFLPSWPWQKDKLVTVATNGSVEEVRRLLDNKADPNTPHKRFQWTPLMYASQQGHTEVVRVLLERGANPNWRAVQGWNALILACQSGFDDIVELLLNHGCDANIQTTTKGWTALHGLCRYIGSSKGNVYAKGKCSDKYVRAVRLLLDHGADVTITEKSGWTPLIIASRNGLVEIVRLLVEKISTFPETERQKALDHTKKQDSWSALMEACAEGHTDVVKVLVDAGASLTLTRGDGASAMHIAVKAGHYEVVMTLILAAKLRKINLNIRDKKGVTPLILATKEKKEGIAKALLKAGANVNLQTEDEDKLTPLLIAAREGKIGLVELLMQHHADPHIRDSRNRSPRELAKNREVRAFFDEVLQQEARQKLQLQGR